MEKIELEKIKFSHDNALCCAIIYSTEKPKEKGTEMTVWDKLANLTEQMGAKAVLYEVARALSTEKLNEVLNFIAKNWDINLDGWNIEE